MTASNADFGPLFNYVSPAHNGTETSKAAAKAIKPSANAIARKVLSYVAASPQGATCDEVEAVLDLKHQTCSARFTDLSKCEPPYLIKCQQPDGSYLKRKTRSGTSAFVWIANQEVA